MAAVGPPATALSGTDAGGITFSFDRAELYRALEHPDFEGHGIREMVMLTVAAASASAALAASTASGQLMEAPGGGGNRCRRRARPRRGDDRKHSRGVRGHPRRSKRRGTGRRPGRSGSRQGIPRGTRHRHASPPSAPATPRPQHSRCDCGHPRRSERRGTGVDQVVPGADEATLAARGIDTEVAAVGTGDATTASELASVTAIHDEATVAARGVGQTIPGADEATLAARGIETPATHDEATLVGRGIETPAVVVDSGSAIEVPSLDSGTAAAIGGLAGAGLLIVGAAFVARRQRTTPA